MNRKTYLENFARESGKINLYAGAMGVIASINGNPFYTSDEKVYEVQQTLSALTAVHANEDIPWLIVKEPSATESPSEIILTDSITRNWTCEDIMRQEG